MRDELRFLGFFFGAARGRLDSGGQEGADSSRLRFFFTGEEGSERGEEKDGEEAGRRIGSVWTGLEDGEDGGGGCWMRRLVLTMTEEEEGGMAEEKKLKSVDEESIADQNKRHQCFHLCPLYRCCPTSFKTNTPLCPLNEWNCTV